MQPQTRVQDHMQAAYARDAPWYDAAVRVLSLGIEARLRQRMIRQLDVHPGDTVVDLACGTGLNFPALIAAIGPAGRIIGVDLSSAMLAVAQQKVVTHGWRNVSLIQADADMLPVIGPADAALCTLAIGLMPNPQAVVQTLVETVRPGGVVLIGDAHVVSDWHGVALNPLLRWVGHPWIPPVVRDRYWVAAPWKQLQRASVDFQYEEWFGGVLYVAWGRRPPTQEG